MWLEESKLDSETHYYKEPSTLEKFLICCGCKRTFCEEGKFEMCSKEGKYSGDPPQETYCNAAFVPEYVRKIIKKQGEIPGRGESIPLAKKLSGILLTCHIPALSEVVFFYSMSIEYPTEDIAFVLNGHVSNLIRNIMSAGGDIVMMEAGYVQCMWLARKEDMEELVQKVLNAALFIQKRFGKTETKFGRVLRNLIGIACGDFECFFVGKKTVYYPLVGETVMDSFYSASQCGQSEVVVSREFWKRIKFKEDYMYQTLPDEFVTVFSLRSLSSPSESHSEEITQVIHTMRETSIDQSLEIFEQQYGEELIHYLGPIHKRAKTTQQMQFISSMSEMVCTAILIKKLDMTTPDVLHKTIEAIREIAEKYRGVVKSIMFKPDIIVTVYFGYPGYRQRNDALQSILFSQEITKTLEDLRLDVITGISSGTMFCGILGTPNRLQCCCMPHTIAFELIFEYSDYNILCCINTYFLTRRFVGEIFEPVKRRMPEIQHHPSTYYEVKMEPKKLSHTVKCLGRENEKKIIVNCFTSLGAKIRNLGEILPLVLLTGQIGMGKTTLLEWALDKAEDMGFKLTSRVYNNSFEESFDNAWTVIQDILEKTGNDTEEAILKLFDNKKNLYPLHKLNEKLNTEFEPVLSLFSEEDIRNMCVNLIRKSTKEKLILIGVDNIEHMGTESWLFLQELLFSKIAIIIATVTEEYRPTIHFVKYIMQQVYKSINMRPLDEEELGLLACTVLNVQAIHKAFLPLFYRYSGGNALRMEEILMIPPLQKHFCLLPASGIAKRRLQTEFLSHPDLKKDPSVSLVCEILDLDELETLQIPSHLLDVVRDHTTGLSPEEQMLIRKCALLGDNFGIYVLEAVCPEYPTVELRCKIRTLIRKNLLRLHCQHLEIVTKDNREMISLKEIPMDFCIHPIKFYCEYLRKSVLNVMAESQRERLNLYLADLLLIPPRCDSCKQEWERRRSFVYPILSRNFRMPCIDMRTCQCLNLKTHFALQVEYQLDKGNGLLKDRIAILVDASEYGILSNSPKLVDKVISKAARLIQKKGDNDKSTPDPASIAVHRLRAQASLLLGKNNEAMRNIKQAFLIMNILFPSDIEKKIYRNKWKDVPLNKELAKCLDTGGFILKVLRMYDLAYRVGKHENKILFKQGHTFYEIIKCKSLLVRVVSKTKLHRKRSLCKSLSNEIRRLCFKRVTEYPILELVELKIVISALKIALTAFLESGDLDATEQLGMKSFQLLVLVRDQKELSRVLLILAHVYYYRQNMDKCFEMISQLEDALHQCADPIAEAIYFTTLVLALRSPGYQGVLDDKMKICNEYATRCPGMPSHPKFRSRVFCLCSHMTTWTSEHNLQDSYSVWYNRASNLSHAVVMDNYWALLGSLALITNKIAKIQKNFVMYTENEFSQVKRALKKELKTIEKACSANVPVLADSVRDTEKRFHVIVQRCNTLRL